MLMRARWAVLALVLAAVTACSPPPMPFDVMGIDAALDTRDVYYGPEATSDVPAQGRVCSRNSQCDDGIECTTDVCGSNNRCANLPNSGMCDDGIFCNGSEACDLRRGCTRGEGVSCNDNNVCTADRCIEMTRICEHLPLDRDGDGDPDEHCMAAECADAGVSPPDSGGACWRGRDCDDSNPRVSSLSPEICGDMIDNNCNGMIDAAETGGCQRAPNDRCDDPLDVSAGGLFTLEMSAARPDYMLRCAGGTAHDMVTRFHLATAMDITLEASSTSTLASLALQTVCGSTVVTDTLGCDNGFPAQLRRHSLPAGDYFVLVASSGNGPIDLNVRFTMATPQPTNDVCAMATSIPVPAGGLFRSDLIGLADDVNTTCGGSSADAIYTFTLTETMDVTLQAAGGRTDYLNLSLTRTCERMPSLVRCDSGSTVQFTSHQLPAGTYFVIVEAFEPIVFNLQATFGPPTPPAHGDTCADPIVLVAGTPQSVSGATMENDYRLTCFTTGRDTVFRFEITTRQDVLIDVAGATGDFFGVAIASECPGTRTTERACTTGLQPRAFALGLDPGTYYAIVKPNRATDYRVTLQTFAPIAITDVANNDTCMTAQAIPPGRGYFRSTTAPLRNEYSSPCAGATPGKDAVYSLHLASRSRVTLVTDSMFFHVAWITRADSCPGTAPVVSGSQVCTLGNRSTLDATLDAGDYYVFIDGLAMTYEGPYGLLVHVSPP